MASSTSRREARQPGSNAAPEPAFWVAPRSTADLRPDPQACAWTTHARGGPGLVAQSLQSDLARAEWLALRHVSVSGPSDEIDEHPEEGKEENEEGPDGLGPSA